MTLDAACQRWLATTRDAPFAARDLSDALAPLATLPPSAGVQLRQGGRGELLLLLPARRPAFSRGARADIVLDACATRPADVAAAVRAFVGVAEQGVVDATATGRDLALLLEGGGGPPGPALETAAMALASGGAEVASSRGLALALVEHGQRHTLRLELVVDGAEAATCLVRLLALALAAEAGPDPDPAVAATIADAAAIHDVAAGVWSAALRLAASRDAAAQALGLDGPLRATWQRGLARVDAISTDAAVARASVELAWAHVDDEKGPSGDHRPRGWAALMRQIEALASQDRCRADVRVVASGVASRSPRQGPLQAAVLRSLQLPPSGLEPVAPLLVLGSFGAEGQAWRQDTVPCLGCLGLPTARLRPALWALLTEG